MYLLFLFLSFLSEAETIHVPSGQPTIQTGIDASAPGDTVLVEPGRYLENINFKGKNIVLGSRFITTGDNSYISNTIIDGNQNGTVVLFESGEDSTAVLCGFTITNGKYTSHSDTLRYQRGSGILCYFSSPKFKNLVVTGNFSDSNEGGAIECYYSNSRFYDMSIINNGGYGVHGAGGVRFLGGRHPAFTRIKIKDNNGTSAGGMYFSNVDSLTLENVEIVNNYAPPQYVGGIFIAPYPFDPNKKTVAFLRNVTMSKNLVGTYGMSIYNVTLFIINSILWDNGIKDLWGKGGGELAGGKSTVYIAHSNLKGGQSDLLLTEGNLQWVNSNIDADPLFINPLFGDYNLQKGSPCIDAGTAFLQVDGQTIIDLPPNAYKGSAPDMGAFESDYTISSVSESAALPRSLEIVSVCPNPFNPSTSISFRLPKASVMRGTVYDVTGRKVKEIVSGFFSAGNHQTTWDASGQASGLYFLRLETGNTVKTTKMLLLK